MTDHKKPGVAFWATVGLVVVLVGYPLSLGPACWLAEKNWDCECAVSVIYGRLISRLQERDHTRSSLFLAQTRATGFPQKTGSAVTMESAGPRRKSLRGD